MCEYLCGITEGGGQMRVRMHERAQNAPEEVKKGHRRATVIDDFLEKLLYAEGSRK
jgi:hypothetical protein